MGDVISLPAKSIQQLNRIVDGLDFSDGGTIDIFIHQGNICFQIDGWSKSLYWNTSSEKWEVLNGKQKKYNATKR